MISFLAPLFEKLSLENFKFCGRCISPNSYATINKFAKQIEELKQKHADNPTELKEKAKEAFLNFHSTLEKGKSRRTLKAFDDLVQDAVESTKNSSLRAVGP